MGPSLASLLQSIPDLSLDELPGLLGELETLKALVWLRLAAPSPIQAPDRLLVACRSEFVTADTAGGVGVFPLDGPSIGGVGVDVASEFASQVGDRGEDAARNDLAFDL